MTVGLRRKWMLARPPLDLPFELNSKSLQAQGLVGWWPMVGSRGGNILRDLGGRGLDGTFWAAGQPGWASDGEFGGVLSFAPGDYIHCADHPSLDIVGGITLRGRIKRSATGRHDVIMTKGSPLGDADSINYEFRFEATNVFRFLYRNAANNAWHVWSTTAVGSAGVWYDFVLSFRFGIGNSIRCYVNGVGESGGWDLGNGNDAPLTNGYPLIIGARLGHGVDFSGLMNEVRLYNRVVGWAEAWQLWDPATRWDLYRPLRRWWTVKWPWVISECRQYEVPLDLRTFKVPIEQRVKTVLRETRTIKVPCEGHG